MVGKDSANGKPNMLTRRTLLAHLLTLPLLSVTACSAAGLQLPEITNLQQAAQSAAQSRIPLMLFVSAPDCHYCHQLERDALAPMLLGQRYTDKVILRRFNLAREQIIDFDGTPQDPMRIAGRYRAQLTPTLLFLSPDGQEIAPRILGVTDLHQYGGMIDARLDQALQTLGNPARVLP